MRVQRWQLIRGVKTLKKMTWRTRQILIFLVAGVAIAGGLAYYVSILSTPTPSPTPKPTPTPTPTPTPSPTPTPTPTTSQNHSPKVTLLYPKGGERLSGVVEISWSASDVDKDTLSITIQYTTDPEPFCPTCPPQTWHDIVVGESNDGRFEWDTTKFKTTNIMIKIIASDGIQTSKDSSVWINISNR